MNWGREGYSPSPLVRHRSHYFELTAPNYGSGSSVNEIERRTLCSLPLLLALLVGVLHDLFNAVKPCGLHCEPETVQGKLDADTVWADGLHGR